MSRRMGCLVSSKDPYTLRGNPFSVLPPWSYTGNFKTMDQSHQAKLNWNSYASRMFLTNGAVCLLDAKLRTTKRPIHPPFSTESSVRGKAYQKTSYILGKLLLKHPAVKSEKKKGSQFPLNWNDFFLKCDKTRTFCPKPLQRFPVSHFPRKGFLAFTQNSLVLFWKF